MVLRGSSWKEVGRQVDEVDRKIQEANTKFLQDLNPTLIDVADLRMRLGQVETSLREEQDRGDMQLKKKPGELMSMAKTVDWTRIGHTGSLLRIPVHSGVGAKVSSQTHLQPPSGQTGEGCTDPQERTKRKEHDQLGMTREESQLKSFSDQFRLRSWMELDTSWK